MGLPTATTYGTAGTRAWVAVGNGTVVVEAWGGGGAGGGARGSLYSGGGGGGGAYSIATCYVTAGSTYNICLGTGGASAAGSYGTAGGYSWFGSPSWLLAEGGFAGGRGWLGVATSGAGGRSSVGTGVTKYSGGAGKAGSNGAGWGGGGGASGRIDGDGYTATTHLGAPGSTSAYGGGGTGGTAHTAGGLPPTYPGGGGGGAGDHLTTARAGGAGHAGQVRLTYWGADYEESVTYSAIPGSVPDPIATYESQLTFVAEAEIYFAGIESARAFVSWIMFEIPTATTYGSVSGTVYEGTLSYSAIANFNTAYSYIADGQVSLSAEARLSVNQYGSLEAYVTNSATPRLTPDAVQSAFNSIALSATPRIEMSPIRTLLSSISLASVAGLVAEGISGARTFNEVLTLSVIAGLSVRETLDILSAVTHSANAKISQETLAIVVATTILASTARVGASANLSSLSELKLSATARVDTASFAIFLASIGISPTTLLTTNYSIGEKTYNEVLTLAADAGISLDNITSIEKSLTFAATPRISVSANVQFDSLFRISATTLVAYNANLTTENGLTNRVTAYLTTNANQVISDKIIVVTQSGAIFEGVINRTYSESITLSGRAQVYFETMRPYYGFEQEIFGGYIDSQCTNKYIHWMTISSYQDILASIDSELRDYQVDCKYIDYQTTNRYANV